MKRLVLFTVLMACSDKKESPAPPPPAPAPPPAGPTKPTAEAPDSTPPPAAKTVAPTPDVPEGNPPPDGKYERVQVEGVTVPMIEVMDGGTVVLVDTDGKKPRTREEQYKRKNVTQRGQFDVVKTDVNHNGKFEDDPID